MIDELVAIRKEMAALDKTVKSLQSRITPARLTAYRNSFLTTKENLIKLRLRLKKVKVSSEEYDDVDDANEAIEVLLDIIRRREPKIEQTTAKMLAEDFRHVRSAFSELSGSLPIEEASFLVDLSTVPVEIREELEIDFDEIRKCYFGGAFKAALSICGRVLEVVLARKYYEKTKVDTINARWPIGQLIKKCFDEKVLNNPAVGDICNLINKSRINSVHMTVTLYKPGPDDTRSIIEFTRGLIKKLYLKSSA
jgi:hypothetical protein